MSEQSIHENHRARMMERFLRNGMETLSDHEVLEILLYYVILRRDTNELAHRLLREFGSLYAVMDAPPAHLQQVEGIGPRAAELICFTHELLRRYQISRKREQQNAIRLITREHLREYFVPQFEGVPLERLIVAYLDNDRRVLRCEINNEGAAGQVRMDFRRLIASTLAVNAAYVALAHNHPGGDALPSQADIALTDHVTQALRDVGCALVEHIIVAEGRCGSAMCTAFDRKRRF